MTKLSFAERAERLERVPGAPRATSGSSGDVRLQPPQNLPNLKTISAVRAPARRGVELPLAKAAIEALVGPGLPVSVHVPHLGEREEFESKMAASGLRVRFLG